MKFNYNEIWKISIRALPDALNWSFWKWLVTVGIGVLTGIIKPLGEELLKWDSNTALYYGLVAVGILFVVRFVIIFSKEGLKYYHEVYKNSIYGDAIIILKNCFSEIHYYKKTPGFREEEFMKSMILFCDNLKIIFDKITNSNCCVSIKVPLSENKVSEGTFLKNLTRDTLHDSRDTNAYNAIKHTIIGNSAFNNCLNKVITNNANKYYLNNNVNKSANYLNTSRTIYDNGVLPYNSELVHSITPSKSPDQRNFDCHGFLCVDSDIKNAFDEKYAPAILEGVADGIYDLIYELNSHKNGQIE